MLLALVPEPRSSNAVVQTHAPQMLPRRGPPKRAHCAPVTSRRIYACPRGVRHFATRILAHWPSGRREGQLNVEIFCMACTRGGVPDDVDGAGPARRGGGLS